MEAGGPSLEDCRGFDSVISSIDREMGSSPFGIMLLAYPGAE